MNLAGESVNIHVNNNKKWSVGAQMGSADAVVL